MRASPWPLLLVTLAAHLALALVLPPVADEAYYALWASAPAAGYYDHPPMIAWMIAAGQAVLGEGLAGLRLPACLCFAGAGWLIWDMARRIDPDAAIPALGVWCASVLTLALGSFATPDAPSVLFWALGLHALLARRWALLGLAGGLGVLSKLTGLFLGLGVLVWLLLAAEGRRALRRPGPWIALALALVVIAPFLLWNAANGWIGLQRQFGRIGAEGFDPLGPPAFLLVTLLLFGAFAGWGLWRGLRRMPPQARPLAVSSAPFLLYLMWHATQGLPAANWIVPLHVPGSVLAGIGLARLGPRLLWAGIGSGAALGLALLALALKPGEPLTRAGNPANEWRGWPATIAEIEALAAEAGAAWIATTHYATTGALWLRLPGRPVWQVTEPWRYLFRGPFPPDLCTAPGLRVLSLSDPGDPPRFAEEGPVRIVLRSAGAAVLDRYAVSAVRGPAIPACP